MRKTTKKPRQEESCPGFYKGSYIVILWRKQSCSNALSIGDMGRDEVSTGILSGEGITSFGVLAFSVSSGSSLLCLIALNDCDFSLCVCRMRPDSFMMISRIHDFPNTNWEFQQALIRQNMASKRELPLFLKITWWKMGMFRHVGKSTSKQNWEKYSVYMRETAETRQGWNNPVLVLWGRLHRHLMT